jgi:outer membrane protein TolC
MWHKTTIAGVLPLLAFPVLLAQHSPARGKGDIISLVEAPTPQTLEEMLAAALRSNPDILLAEAKLRQAQAELNQARLQVTQRVATLYYDRKKQQQLKEELGVVARIVEQQVKAGRGTPKELTEAILNQAEAEAKLSQVEADIRYVVGLGGELHFPEEERAEADREEEEAPPRRPEIPPETRKLLEMPWKVEWQQISLRDALTQLQQAAGDEVAFLLDPDIDGEELQFTLSFPREIPLRNVLLALTDFQDELCFVVRDYGILLTPYERAATMDSPTIPADVPLEPE